MKIKSFKAFNYFGECPTSTSALTCITMSRREWISFALPPGQNWNPSKKNLTKKTKFRSMRVGKTIQPDFRKIKMIILPVCIIANLDGVQVAILPPVGQSYLRIQYGLQISQKD